MTASADTLQTADLVFKRHQRGAECPLGCEWIGRAKVTQRGWTLTERPPAVDPDGTAMDRLGTETACQGCSIKARCHPGTGRQLPESAMRNTVGSFQAVVPSNKAAATRRIVGIRRAISARLRSKREAGDLGRHRFAIFDSRSSGLGNLVLP